MKMKFHKRRYETPAVSAVAMEGRESLLGASIVNPETTIMSVGQELGPVYDFNAAEGIDPNTGKTFSHEWETGPGSSSL